MSQQHMSTEYTLRYHCLFMHLFCIYILMLLTLLSYLHRINITFNLLYTSTVVSNMPLTVAEMQRRYRARRDQDPERKEQYLLWEKKKYKRDREQGKKKA